MRIERVIAVGGEGGGGGGGIHCLDGLFQYSYQKREAKITKSFRCKIINLSFHGFTYNTCGHFARIFPRPFGARKITAHLAKYPRVLYVKPSNKIYLIEM